jgi:nitrogen regulatory protein PII
MRLVRALLHTADLDRVVTALTREGFHGMTIAEIVHCDSRRAGRPHVTLRNEVTVAVHGDRVNRLLRALRAARLQRELQVTLQPLCQAVRIRTGERDQAAIWQ